MLLFDGHRGIACAHVLLCFALICIINRVSYPEQTVRIKIRLSQSICVVGHKYFWPSSGPSLR